MSGVYPFAFIGIAGTIYQPLVAGNSLLAVRNPQHGTRNSQQINHTTCSAIYLPEASQQQAASSQLPAVHHLLQRLDVRFDPKRPCSDLLNGLHGAGNIL